MPDELLIDQALAINAAAEPVRLGGPGIPITPQQALVHTVYLTAKDVDRGWANDALLDRYVRTARSAGIAQHEIEAALERARPS